MANSWHNRLAVPFADSGAPGFVAHPRLHKLSPRLFAERQDFRLLVKSISEIYLVGNRYGASVANRLSTAIPKFSCFKEEETPNSG